MAASYKAVAGNTSEPFSAWAKQGAARLERALEARLPGADRVPARLHEAMRYAALGGGKRVRPLLVYASAELQPAEGSGAGGGMKSIDSDALDAAASAVECIHAYSLVPDDLPCMDDDDLRRGRPTVHVQYDEATAMLVGDGLQTLAFTCLTELPEPAMARALRTLAHASGSLGMVGGQAIDLSAVGRQLGADEIEQMHRMKTGALLQASVMLGWYVSASGRPVPASLQTYAEAIGLAFQVVDDILDVEADTATLGKTAGKDADHDKPTYVTALGLDQAKQFAGELAQRADDALAEFGESARRLRELADLIVRRTH